MMSSIISGAAASMLAVALFTSGTTLWMDRAGGPIRGADFALDVALSDDGSHAYVVGWSSAGSDDRDYLTVGYDTATGDRLWSRRYAAGWAAEAVAVDPSGTQVFVTGSDATIAYDATSGATRWISPFGGYRHLGADDVAVSSETVFVTGSAQSGSQTIAYDADSGAERWRRIVPGFIGTRHLSVSEDGSSIAVVSTVATNAATDYDVIVLEATNGSVRWTGSYDGPAHLQDGATSVAIAGDRVVVTGESEGFTSVDRVTVAFDLTTGEVAWTRRFDGPAHLDETVPSVVAVPDGSAVVVIGRSEAADGRNDYVTTVYGASDGATRWQRRLLADVPSYVYFPPALAVSPDGQVVIVTGRTGDNDYLTAAYRMDDGLRSWSRRFDRWGWNAPSAVAIGPNGVAVVTGTTWVEGVANSNYATVAYAI